MRLSDFIFELFSKLCHSFLISFFFVFFFFQAEDGIRDLTVTGVQTCALPISSFPKLPLRCCALGCDMPTRPFHSPARRLDRKSTRLNSSHSQISYAVFCLQKKIKPPTS